MLGAMSRAVSWAASSISAPLLRRVPRGGDDERNAPGDARRQHGHRAFRHGKVDQRLDPAVVRQRIAQRHADRAESAHFADVAADERVAWRLQGRAQT